jgi:hypothetical protein
MHYMDICAVMNILIGGIGHIFEITFVLPQVVVHGVQNFLMTFLIQMLISVGSVDLHWRIAEQMKKAICAQLEWPVDHLYGWLVLNTLDLNEA